MPRTKSPSPPPIRRVDTSSTACTISSTSSSLPGTSTLCYTCRKWVAAALPKKTKLRVKDIEKRRAAGCVGCAVLLNTMAMTKENGQEREVDGRTNVDGSGRLSSTTMFLHSAPTGQDWTPLSHDPNTLVAWRMVHISNGDEVVRLGFQAMAYQEDGEPGMGREQPVFEDVRPWGEGFFDVSLLRRWLRVCEGGHKKCLLPEKGTLPRHFRLIDLKLSCIREANSYFSGRYVALSYMWPSSSSTSTPSCPTPCDMLLKSNTVSLSTPGSLQTTHLPPILLEAIRLTRALGQEYLWIDRLCIVQDDPLQKDSQITAMDTIFENAKLTLILALQDRNATVIPGFTPSAPRPAAAHLTRTKSLPVSPTSHKLNCSPLPNKDDRYPSPLEDSVSQSRWDKRGWTFQEKLFSLRRLYITPHEVFFECPQSSACEHLTWGLQNLLAHARYFGNTLSFDVVDKSEDPRDLLRRLGMRRNRHRAAAAAFFKKEPHLGEYGALVQEYASRELTRKEDVLQAFAGVTARFSRAWDTGFIYGLPERYLIEALFWGYTSGSRGGGGGGGGGGGRGGGGGGEMEVVEGVPTWSWARFPGRGVEYAQVLNRLDRQWAPGPFYINEVEGIMSSRGPLRELCVRQPPKKLRRYLEFPHKLRCWHMGRCSSLPCLSIDREAQAQAKRFVGGLMFNALVITVWPRKGRAEWAGDMEFSNVDGAGRARMFLDDEEELGEKYPVVALSNDYVLVVERVEEEEHLVRRVGYCVITSLIGDWMLKANQPKWETLVLI